MNKNEIGTDRIDKNKQLFLWQLRCGLLMSTMYLFYYFCKYNIKIALPLIREEFQFSYYEVGWITSALLIVYCVGQFINGWLGDKYGPRKIVSIQAVSKLKFP